MNTGHVTYEELSNAAINQLWKPQCYGGGKSYIVIPYLLSTPIGIVTSHLNPTAYVFYIAGQEELLLATITHANNHFQWTVTGM